MQLSIRFNKIIYMHLCNMCRLKESVCLLCFIVAIVNCNTMSCQKVCTVELGKVIIIIIVMRN